MCRITLTRTVIPTLTSTLTLARNPNPNHNPNPHLIPRMIAMYESLEQVTSPPLIPILALTLILASILNLPPTWTVTLNVILNSMLASIRRQS